MTYSPVILETYFTKHNKSFSTQRHAYSSKPLKQLKPKKIFFLMVPQKTYFTKNNNDYKAPLIAPESLV
jgi:hypothetical protein